MGKRNSFSLVDEPIIPIVNLAFGIRTPRVTSPTHSVGPAAFGQTLATSQWTHSVNISVPPAGLEPAAYGLGNRRSILLSYEGVRTYAILLPIATHFATTFTALASRMTTSSLSRSLRLNLYTR